MPIEDVFGIKGRGTVVTGRVEKGLVKTGIRSRSLVAGYAEHRGDGGRNVPQVVDSGQAGDNIGCLLRGIERDDVERGMCWRRRDRSSR